MEILIYIINIQKYLLKLSSNRKNTKYLLLIYYKRIKDGGKATTNPY